MSILSRFKSGSSSKSGSKNTTKAPFQTTPATASRLKNILGIKSLAPMPAQAAKAFHLASDPKAGSADFVSLIEGDEALSSRIIRIANSVYFLRGDPVNDIERAVVNIGLEEIRCLLSASMLQGLLGGRHPARKQFWANAVATAICSKTLSSNCPSINSGEAFLAGLVHDVGKLIMLQRGQEQYDKVLEIVATSGCSFVSVEEKVFETNHVEVGQWAAETWNFPQSAIIAIAYHHWAWPKSGQAENSLTPQLLVKIANTIAHSCGFGLPPAMHRYRERATKDLVNAFELLGISEAEGQVLIDNLQRQFEEEMSLYEEQL